MEIIFLLLSRFHAFSTETTVIAPYPTQTVPTLILTRYGAAFQRLQIKTTSLAAEACQGGDFYLNSGTKVSPPGHGTKIGGEGSLVQEDLVVIFSAFSHLSINGPV